MKRGLITFQRTELQTLQLVLSKQLANTTSPANQTLLLLQRKITDALVRVFDMSTGTNVQVSEEELELVLDILPPPGADATTTVLRNKITAELATLRSS